MRTAHGAKHIHSFNGARLLAEPPIRLRGAAFLRSDLHVGAYTVLGRSLEAQGASIGRYCEVGPNVLLGATGHPTEWLGISSFQYKAATWSWHESADACAPLNPEAGGRESFRGAPAHVGNDVWIGANVVVLGGVAIGDGAVIGANSVVTKDVQPYTIVGGVPAKPLRKRFDDEKVSELLELAWWRFSPNQLNGVDFDQIDDAIAEIRLRTGGGMEPYTPEVVEIKKPAPRVPATDPAPVRKRRFFRRYPPRPR